VRGRGSEPRYRSRSHRRPEPLETIVPFICLTLHSLPDGSRGHGASADSAEYSLQKGAEDVAAVVNSRPGTVFVLGHSIGGVCALEAVFLTDKISKLVLYEPPLQDRNHDAVEKVYDAAKQIRAANSQPKDSFGAARLPDKSSITAAPLNEILGAQGESKDRMVKFTFGRSATMHGTKIRQGHGRKHMSGVRG